VAVRLWCERGGIRSLLGLIRQHREAIEYDLIGLGLRLDDRGTRGLSWRDLLVIIRRSPRTSALSRAQFPEDSEWGLPEQLLAAIFDALQAGNWQRGNGQGRKPEQLPRPGVTPERKRRGGEPIPLDEMRKWLGWDEATTTK
jgi:hypothetical protein